VFATSLTRPRLLIVAGALGVSLIGATGFIAAHAFSQQSTLKYAVTAIAPLLIVATALAAEPLRVLAAAAIFTAPLEFVTTFHGVSVSAFTVLLAMACVIALLDYRAVRPPTPTGTVITLVVALLAPAVVLGSSQGHYAGWIIETVAAGWVAFVIASQPGGLRFIVGMVVITATFQSLVGLYEVVTRTTVNLYSTSGTAAVQKSDYYSFNGDTHRPPGTLTDPIALGNLLALSCPLAVSLAVSARPLLHRLAWAACGGLIAMVLVLTFSRMSWIGGPVGIAVALAALPSRARITAAIGVAAVGFVALTLAVGLSGTALTKRFDSIAHPTSTSNQTAQGDRLRIRIWHAAEDAGMQHPLTGTGFGNLQPKLGRYLGASPKGLHAHSVYLQFFASAGLCGVLALLLLVVHCLAGFIRGMSADRLLMSGMLGALAATLVTWTTDTSLRYTEISAMLAFTFGAGLAQRWLVAPVPAPAPAVVAVPARPTLALAGEPRA
jgi:O-antigen ligase